MTMKRKFNSDGHQYQQNEQSSVKKV